MIVTILWEDQRGGDVKGFGPQLLLHACLTDRDATQAQLAMLKGVPKKGVGNVLKTLRDDGQKLCDSGPVVAVIDRDRIRDHVKSAADCLSSLLNGIRTQAPTGKYQVVFLIRNIETLVDICRVALELPRARPHSQSK